MSIILIMSIYYYTYYLLGSILYELLLSLKINGINLLLLLLIYYDIMVIFLNGLLYKLCYLMDY